MKKFQDFWRISFFLPFGWPHDDIYCLTRDNTALTHLVIALVNIRCGLDENKSVNMPYLRPNSVHFGPIYDQNCSFFHIAWIFLWQKNRFSTTAVDSRETKIDTVVFHGNVKKLRAVLFYFVNVFVRRETWNIWHEAWDMTHETWFSKMRAAVPTGVLALLGSIQCGPTQCGSILCGPLYWDPT